MRFWRRTKAISPDTWVSASIERPAEHHLGYRPAALRNNLQDLYAYWPYRCALLNAQGVASTPLRVYRGVQRHDGIRTRRLSAERSRRLAESVRSMHQDDTYEEVTDSSHPLVSLLRNPSDQHTGDELIELLTLSLQLTGNAFAHIVQPVGPEGAMPPTHLLPMPVPWVRIAMSEDDYIAHYRYGRDASREVTLQPYEVMHVRLPNPTGKDTAWGVGVMQAAAYWHHASIAATRAAEAVYRNGGWPSMIAVYPDATPEQVESSIRRIRGMLQGAFKAGSIVGMNRDVRLTRWQMTADELGFLQAQKDYRDFIAAMFGVPVGLLTVENVNLANSRVAAPQWQLLTLRPLARKIEAGLNYHVLPYVRAAVGDPTLCVAFDDPIEEQQDQRASRAVSLYTSGIATLNEARTIIGEDPLPGGDRVREAGFPGVMPFGPVGGAGPRQTDTPRQTPTAAQAGQAAGGETGLDADKLEAIRTTLQTVADGMLDAEAAIELIMIGSPELDREAVTRMVQAAARTRPQPDAGANDDADDGTGIGNAPQAGQRAPGARGKGADGQGDRGDRTEPAARSYRLLIYTGMAEHDHAEEHPARCVTEAGQIVWKSDDIAREYDRLVQRIEDQMADRLEPYYRRLFSELAGQITEQGLAADLSPDSDAAVALREAMSEPVFDAVQAGIQYGLAELPELGESVRQDAIERARAYLDQYLIILSESTLSTVRDGVEYRLAQALADEAFQDFRDVQRAVAEAMEQDATYLSRRIARTESVRMAQEGRLESWVSSQIVARKAWLTRGDNKVAEPCLTIAREYGEAAVNEPFVPFGMVIAGFRFDYDPRGLMSPPGKPNCRCTMVPVL